MLQVDHLPVLSMFRHDEIDRDNAIFITESIDNRLERIDRTDVVIAVLYSAIGLFGMVGNTRVLYIMIRSDVFKGRNCYRDQSHIFNYILCLCIVDTLVLIFLPVIVVDTLHNQWYLGQFFCRVFWTCESLNKIMSTFLLVALSANCYVGVCRPSEYHQWKSPKFSGLLIAICGILSTGLITPVFLFSDVYGFGHVVNDTLTVYLVKCIFHAPPEVQTFFTFYIICVGFFMTGIIQIVFYVLLLRFLYKHKEKTGPSESREQRFWHVVKIVMMLVAFYFLCWTPYWAVTLFTYFRAQADSTKPGSVGKLFFYIIHALPYINSAANPTLYSRLLSRHQTGRHNSATTDNEYHTSPRANSLNNHCLHFDYHYRKTGNGTTLRRQRRNTDHQNGCDNGFDGCGGANGSPNRWSSETEMTLAAGSSVISQPSTVSRKKSSVPIIVNNFGTCFAVNTTTTTTTANAATTADTEDEQCKPLIVDVDVPNGKVKDCNGD